jgi:hypothetical protein
MSAAPVPSRSTLPAIRVSLVLRSTFASRTALLLVRRVRGFAYLTISVSARH